MYFIGNLVQHIISHGPVVGKKRETFRRYRLFDKANVALLVLSDENSYKSIDILFSVKAFFVYCLLSDMSVKGKTIDKSLESNMWL